MGKDKRKTEDVDILEEDLQDEIDDEMEPDAQALQEAEEELKEAENVNTEEVINNFSVGEDDDTVNTIRLYLSEIGSIPLLTREEEVELAKQIEKGGKEAELAKTKMINANLRLVVSVAKRYANSAMPFMDVVQEGSIGLIKAVDRFDYTKGYKFSTYSIWWIRQSITRGLEEYKRIIRIPAHVSEKINKMTRIEKRLEQEYGRIPTDKEIAKDMGITEDTIKELREYTKDTVSLEKPVGTEEDTLLMDFIEDGSASIEITVERQALKEQLLEILDTMSDREARIIKDRYGLETGVPKTLEQIGKEYGITRERVRQIQGKALKVLKHKAKGKLDDFNKA